MAGATFSVSVSVDTSVLDALTPKMRPTAASLIRKHAYQFEAVAKENAPLDTGALRNSIHVSDVSELTATIQDGVEYGVYQEFGVAHPYTIDAPVYIRGVGWRYIKIHPGLKPQPFFTPAAEKVGESYFIEYWPLLGVS